MSEAMQDEALVGRPAVGMRLRAAREAAGLTLDQVAHSLKFSPRQIERLEADDYAALPVRTIVRGFVRGYARLLRLDAGELLEMLEDTLPCTPADVRPPDNIGTAAVPVGRRELSPLFSVALVVLLAATLLALWHFFGSSSPRPTTVVSRGEPQAPAVPPPPAAAAPVETPPAAAVVPVEPAPAVAPDTAPATASGMSAASLRFVFAELAWIEVVDADKRLLRSGENPGGTQLTLTGRAPFEIVIGNASKVSLSYGDRPVDLAPYMRAEVARLKLE